MVAVSICVPAIKSARTTVGDVLSEPSGVEKDTPLERHTQNDVFPAARHRFCSEEYNV